MLRVVGWTRGGTDPWSAGDPLVAQEFYSSALQDQGNLFSHWPTWASAADQGVCPTTPMKNSNSDPCPPPPRRPPHPLAPAGAVRR